MIKVFKDLIAWQKAHELVLDVYKITKKFPDIERYGLENQLRRASVSITSNIAEGFGRNSRKEKLQFYSISRGSLFEVLDQLTIAKDLGYFESQEFIVLEEKINVCSRLVSGIIKSASDKILI